LPIFFFFPHTFAPTLLLEQHDKQGVLLLGRIITGMSDSIKGFIKSE
jgi:hypothetical protein